jgi:hypothetical protein
MRTRLCVFLLITAAALLGLLVGGAGPAAAGSFVAQPTAATGSGPSSVAVGDFNADGSLDLVAANYNANTVSVLLGNGDGTLKAKVDYVVGKGPNSVAVGDFNADGSLDLVAANYNANTVSVLLGNGNGTFKAKVDYAVGKGPWSVAVGDLNGDSKLDIVTANWNASTVSVLLGNGDGTFKGKVNYVVGKEPSSVAVGDLNGGGLPDLVTANSGKNTASVLLNSGPWTPLPTISGLDVSSGTVGTTVTVNGSGFGASQGTSSLRFGVATATITSWSDTEIVCTVPTAAVGKAAVVVTTAVWLSNSASFKVTPHLNHLKPIKAKPGVTVTISGSGFGAKRGTSKVLFGSVAVSKYVSWSATKIKVKVPKLAKGKRSVTVRTSGGKSNAKTFKVI